MHLILDITCTKNLNKAEVVSDFILDVVRLLNLHLCFLHIQEFPNGTSYGPGISGTAIISESHVCVHTAPERNLLQLCIHSCRDFGPEVVQDIIRGAFGVMEVLSEEILPR